MASAPQLRKSSLHSPRAGARTVQGPGTLFSPISLLAQIPGLTSRRDWASPRWGPWGCLKTASWALLFSVLNGESQCLEGGAALPSMGCTLFRCIAPYVNSNKQNPPTPHSDVSFSSISIASMFQTDATSNRDFRARQKMDRVSLNST
ncbi:hypothetical protein BO71DRAFT_429326 [Aspergillus ellipticus CBS 707.79]|uniref:Uncharacterized protein n=1 Tax=Aspergillus ellipticus CBS 707.79 TaxID=1448320 RepID=A0A319E3H4_9EURO|nr:hypothetical protein BO71DRAFT_429326 [Aspergillus ellipticus CBS 707.79]